jgi:hypothetical protein
MKTVDVGTIDAKDGPEDIHRYVLHDGFVGRWIRIVEADLQVGHTAAIVRWKIHSANKDRMA